MKKIYLTMLALLAFASVNAQVTETDWASMNDVVALKHSEFPKGSGVVQIPICVKGHEDFQGVTFYIQLPEGLSVATLDPVVEARKANIASGSNMHTGNIQSDGTYKVLSTVAGSTSTGAKAYYTKGSADDDYLFAYISVDVSSLDPGEYPMKIVTETHFSKFNETGEPSIKLYDEITTALVILNEVVLDELDTTWPGTYSGVDVKVLRTISANNWNTICLPFDMSEEQCKAAFGDDVELATFNGYLYDEAVDENFINVRFTTANSITKNVPCIIKVSTAIAHDDGFTVENVNIEPAANSEGLTVAAIERTRRQWSEMIGLYKVTTLEKDLLFLSGNKFYYTSSNQSKPTTMKGFRAYFDFYDIISNKDTGISTDDVKFIFTFDDEPTSIDGMASAEKIKGVYTVSGVKVAEDSLEGLPKGVYIVNGKKVLVK